MRCYHYWTLVFNVIYSFALRRWSTLYKVGNWCNESFFIDFSSIWYIFLRKMFELVYHDTSMRHFFTNDDTCIFVLIKRNTFIWSIAVARRRNDKCFRTVSWRISISGTRWFGNEKKEKQLLEFKREIQHQWFVFYISSWNTSWRSCHNYSASYTSYIIRMAHFIECLIIFL